MKMPLLKQVQKLDICACDERTLVPEKVKVAAIKIEFYFNTTISPYRRKLSALGRAFYFAEHTRGIFFRIIFFYCLSIGISRGWRRGGKWNCESVTLVLFLLLRFSIGGIERYSKRSIPNVGNFHLYVWIANKMYFHGKYPSAACKTKTRNFFVSWIFFFLFV